LDAKQSIRGTTKNPKTPNKTKKKTKKKLKNPKKTKKNIFL